MTGRSIGMDIARGAEWGGMSIMVNKVPPDFDLTPIVGQLPGGACSVPHWGYVIEGSLSIGYTDGTRETISAGELFHFPAGHSQFGSADGARWIEISPAAEMADVVAKMMELMAEPGQAQARPHRPRTQESNAHIPTVEDALPTRARTGNTA